MNPKSWTYSDLLAALQKVVSAASPYTWIVDVKPLAPSVIYGDGGKSYEAPYAVADDGTITLGTAAEVVSQTVYWPADQAAFAFASAPDASGRVRWSGLIFRAGRFPERPIREITADDVAAIAASVPAEGVPIRIDHNERSFLTDALDRDGARLLRAWAVGDELHGEVEVPGWFAAAARDLVKKVSVGLTDTLRGIRELSFVRNPRIEDAAVFRTLPAFTAFAKAHPDLAASLTPVPPASAPRDRIMDKKTFMQIVQGWFGILTPEQRGAVTETDIRTLFDDAPNPTAPTTPDPHLAARIDALERDHATRGRQDRALAFYGEQLQAGRATPAERSAVVDDYVAAEIADEAQRFSADAPESFRKRLTDRYAGRKPQFSFGGNRIGSASPNLDIPSGSFFDDSDFERAFGAKDAK